MQSIILASQSPRRKQLLEWAEIPFEVIVQQTDESYPAGLATEDIPVYIARQKALQVHEMICTYVNKDRDNHTILAADTVVVLDDQIIGKPASRQDALHTLALLSGKTHRVITGVVILKQQTEIAFADITSVEFYDLTSDQIAFYVDKYKPYDKAGAYAIQEWIGVTGIKSVNGDFYNVMGLPISRVVRELKKFI